MTMDVSSQEKLLQKSNSLATNKSVSESNHDVKSNGSYDEEVLKNHESVEGLTGMGSSPRKIASEHLSNGASKCSNHEQLEATEGNGNKELSQQKRGRPRRKESLTPGTPRVLRARSHEKPKIPEPVDAPPSQDTESKEKKRRKMKKIKKDQNNEFSKIKTHLRYLLNRMRYEQNFLEAYAGEGWKGQSLEKLRPEKELERAKSDINRYKLRIRNLFQRIDTSCEEGRIPDSLYDSEGLIDSEDIFCAKCGQTEVRLDNDIILCDGACERGFHQFCLDPPLLKEQVPPGDEGWLCPACDCKVDCFDLLNDSQGINFSVTDSWEKVFPETAASGNKLEDNSGLLSDDSGDDDYNPDGPEVEEEVDAEDSSSDESDDSDFSSASEDLGAVANNDPLLGLPSDDSEDDDFNPDKVDSDEDEEAKAKSSSSDFTSDSDDLADINKNEVTSAEIQEPTMSENEEEITKTNMEDDDCGPITAKRRVERLDYKKLHDETYGNVSSDSSDEDFSDSEGPKRPKNTKGAKNEDSNKKQKQKQNETTPITRTSSKKLDIEGTSSSPAHKDSSAVGSSEKSGSKSQHRRLGEAATQGLYASFKENRYPDRNVRENLAKELNLTYNQVSKWFDNARWSFNHPEKRTKTVAAGKSPAGPTEKSVTKQANEPRSITKQINEARSITKQTNEVTPITKQANEATPITKQANETASITKQANEAASITKKADETTSATPKSRKRKAKADHQDTEITPGLKEASPMDSSNRATRRSSRVQAKRL